MRIKKLEISGFKSFADPVRLWIGDGITGVVGPNGCGKSNIVDAIRWCMGEMSAKHLRGQAMQDVIFAGSEHRGPLGRAEVTLTFHNDGQAPASYLNYTEIEVSRRLYRDGTSEYLINKIPVRLRDITDLFLGTGVGTRAYSIIEQGRIGFVVNSKPEERRTLIEEVAGITKFKSRKKAAEKRLEATEQNISRVNDVIMELERQLVSLRKQAEKAKRYREVRSTLKHMELQQAALDYLELQVRQESNLKKLRGAQQATADANRHIHVGESKLDALRLVLLEKEKALQEKIGQTASDEKDLATLQLSLQHKEQQLRQYHEHHGAWQEEIGRLQQRQEALSLQILEKEAACQGLETTSQDRHELIADYQQKVAQLQQQLQRQDASLEALQSQILRQTQLTGQKEALVTNLQQQHEQNRYRTYEFEEEQAQLQMELEACTSKAAALEKQHQQLHALQQQYLEEQKQSSLHEEKLKAKIGQLQEDLQVQKEIFHQQQSRKQSLSEILQRFEGYSQGVRSLMQDTAASEGGLSPSQQDGQNTYIKPLALVTQLLDVPTNYERAIEAALSERLQYMLMADAEGVFQNIAYLHQQAMGRGGFVVVEEVALTNSNHQQRRLQLQGQLEAILGTAFFTWAVDVVQLSDSRYPGIIEQVLGNVLILKDLQSLQYLQKSSLLANVTFPGMSCVTLSGEVLTAEGFWLGGQQDDTGLLANRREIRDLAESLQGLQDILLSQQQHLHELKATEKTLQEKQKQLQAALHEQALQEREVQKDKTSLIEAQQRLEERLQHLAQTIFDLQEKNEELLEAVAHGQQQSKEAHQESQRLEQETQSYRQQRQGQQLALEEAQQQLTDVQINTAKATEQAQAAIQALQQLKSYLKETEKQLFEKQSDLQLQGSQVRELAEAIAQGHLAQQEQQNRWQSQCRVLQEAKALYQQQQDILLQEEQALKENRKGSQQLADTIMQANALVQEQQYAKQHLCSRILERYDIELIMVLPMYHTSALPTSADKKQRHALEQQLKSIGSVNLLAIEECDEVENRYQFLLQQKEDLQEALQILKSAIGRINEASRERFQEAFTQVNTMFQEVYPRLFRGGTARLELTGSEDLLDAGVDIVAMPPGKKLQNVSLLSGGEKALTATAFVFSIFLIKPSPFCILDEVDAPLDEANVQRFNEMLQEISKISQFIVITHNKQTMLRADKLYGITMENAGMSKVVAVDLSGGRNQAA